MSDAFGLFVGYCFQITDDEEDDMNYLTYTLYLKETTDSSYGLQWPRHHPCCSLSWPVVLFMTRLSYRQRPQHMPARIVLALSLYAGWQASSRQHARRSLSHAISAAAASQHLCRRGGIVEDLAARCRITSLRGRQLPTARQGISARGGAESIKVGAEASLSPSVRACV